jgi:hypothetical protein
MANDKAIKQFALAGKSTFTIKNIKTGVRFTYYIQAAHNRKVWFVKGLIKSNYTYFGTIFHNGFRQTSKSKVTADTIIVKAFNWFWKQLYLGKPLPNELEVYHEGKCGRCGRRLTVPESINTGYGPICIKLINRGIS